MVNKPEPGHETRDIDFKALALATIGLLLLLVILSGAMLGFYALLTTHEAQSDQLNEMVTPVLPPEPRLESVPGQTIEQLRATEKHLLNSYEWVDRKNGIVRIPIERAMQLLAQRGLPARQPSADQGGEILEF